jgi:hypothetical protein
MENASAIRAPALQLLGMAFKQFTGGALVLDHFLSLPADAGNRLSNFDRQVFAGLARKLSRGPIVL